MWVASSYTPGVDRAYIVASLGKAACGSLCSALLTRFVTVTFPSPSLSVSTFFTDPELNPLSLDSSGDPVVNVFLARGIVQRMTPSHVLTWVNATNTGTTPLQSFTLNERLPIDWSVNPPWMPAKGAVHVYYANTNSLGENLEITRTSMLTLSTDNPETISLSISSFNNTTVHHPLLPGQSILMSVKLTYSLLGTSQSLTSYPRNYTVTSSIGTWNQPYYSGAEASATSSSFFTAYAKVTDDPGEQGNVHHRTYTLE
jgi:hypothetical protein